MAGDGVRRLVPVELADARAEDDRQGERREATGGVHDARAGEVDGAVPPAEAVTELGEEAAAPHPVAVDRVDDRAHRDLGEEERGERDPLGDGADDDVAGRLHEHDLEQEEGEHTDVVAVAALQEEPVEPDEPRVAVREDAAQGGQATEVGDRRDAAELKREPDGEVRDQRDGERGHVHHHHVARVFRSA